MNIAMKIICLILYTLLLCPLLSPAQQKNDDSSIAIDENDFRNLRGHMNMSYNGERLSMQIVTYFPDTSTVVKKLIQLKEHCLWFQNMVGKVKVGEDEITLSLGSTDILYEIHNHQVKVQIALEDVYCVINETQHINILIINFSPDSATFTCTGSESITEVCPSPVSFTRQMANWTATDTNFLARHSEYQVVLESSAKGAFGFSRLLLIRENQKLTFFWEKTLRYILITVPFWFLWYIFFRNKVYFSKEDQKMIGNVIKWLPWLVGIYLVIILDETALIWVLRRSIAIDNMKDLQDMPDATTLWRVILILIAILLLIFQRLLKRDSPTAGIQLLKTVCKTLATSTLAFVVLGVVNQFANWLGGKTSLISNSLGYHILEVHAHYAVWTVCMVYLFIIFVFFRLFAFNRKLQVLVISLIILFAPFEHYYIHGEGERQDNKSGITFTFTTKDIGEANNGALHLTTCFEPLADQFACIPFLFAAYLIVISSYSADEYKRTVAITSLSTLFYCGYMVGLTDTYFLLPVTLLFSLWLSRWIFVFDKRDKLALVQTAKNLYSLEATSKLSFKRIPELRQLATLKNKYRNKLLSGELLPADYKHAIADLDEMAGSRHGETIQRRMEFGPFQQSLLNGWHGMKYGAIVTALAYFVYFKLYLFEDYHEIQILPNLLKSEITSLMLYHLSPVMKNSIAGFILGYFFPFIKGCTGWEKGARLGAAIGSAFLPYIYFSNESPGWTPLTSIFFKHIILLLLTGFLAFDVTTIRKIYGRTNIWKQVVEVMGWKSTFALGSFLFAAITTGLAAWISGNVHEMLKAVLGGK
ncbi:hypothetical protein L3C95_09665 [Chitinophaga filiformis]|uniref:hypothetical protein n=1 Tax=Chitinophaga filiformis TaxID=104663 RepID=UPI001F1E4A1B|nr:hypothetical protein [Chitinophaga filiformis]MCF6403141.1 hypothetical protein [Chitinophaga filiformis]